jgi:hypothetical protein
MCQSLSNFAHRFRVFKARMVYYASFERNYWCADGSQHVPQHWFELAKEHWTQAYRSTGTLCSCPLCRGEEYSRLAYKCDTHRIIRESMD